MPLRAMQSGAQVWKQGLSISRNAVAGAQRQMIDWANNL